MPVPLATSNIQIPFTFAVIGDTHFSLPKFHPGLVHGPESPRPLTTEKYIENVRHVLTPTMEALKKEGPDFIVMTGDLVEGSIGSDQALAEMEACLSFFGGFEIPMLICKGNQDSSCAFDEVIRPYLSRMLGSNLDESHYFTDMAGCRFILMDTTDWLSNDQCSWLRKLLQQAEETRMTRIFVFGHHPIWPVARSHFTNEVFCRQISSLLAECSVDAYFCGHTHNQNIIQHRTDGLPVLQFMSAPIGLADEIPVPLNRVARILPREEDLLFCWPGYLENTAPGWFKVAVGIQDVKVEWHHLIRGVETRTEWRKRGDVDTFDYMRAPADAKLISTDLHGLKRAFLRFCAWHSETPGKCLVLNGAVVGEMPTGSQYVPLRMELPAWCLTQLKMENRIEIQVVDGDTSTIGNLVLEGVLSGGRIARTRPTGEVFTWTNDIEDWGWGGTLCRQQQGRPARTMLSFS
jgi:predicted phosphodiesterase